MTFELTVIIIAFVVALFLIGAGLHHLDEHKDYSAGVKFFFYSDRGNHRISIPYYIWQSGKRKAIKQIFINTIEYEGRD
jgi:hypothetical protein